MAGGTENGGARTPFAAGDITASPRKREKSEPASLHSTLKAVMAGPSHPTHEQPPVKTIASASLMQSADENYVFHEETAVHKFEYPLPKLAVLGILGGAYIGFGYSLCCVCAGLQPVTWRHENPGLFNFLFGIYGFPTGLMLCVVAGADLFTSYCMYSAIGVWEGRFGLYGWARMLVVSYFANLVGALLLVGLMMGGDVWTNPAGRGDFIVELAEKKVLHTGWGAVLLRGVLGNWLVCLAVWQGNMGRDFAGRFIGVWLPDAAFVSLGLEHCIANMYLCPMGMILGAKFNTATFIRNNLIPSTLGNLIGGSVLVGTFYALSLGTPGHMIQDAWDAKLERVAQRLRARRSSGTARAAGAGSPGAFQLSKSGRRESTVPLKGNMVAQRSASPDTAATIAIPTATLSPRRRSGIASAEQGLPPTIAEDGGTWR